MDPLQEVFKLSLIHAGETIVINRELITPTKTFAPQDKTEIGQIFANTIENVVRARQSDGGEIPATIVAFTSPTQVKHVSDTCEKCFRTTSGNRLFLYVTPEAPPGLHNIAQKGFVSCLQYDKVQNAYTSVNAPYA